MTVDEFEMKLVELMHGPNFALQDPEVQDKVKEMLGHEPTDGFNIEPMEIDMDLVSEIGDYLVNEEELGGEEETEDAHIVQIGLFIYGFVQSRCQMISKDDDA